jgi:carbon monoxide dehydrogenase subunit G
MRVVESIVVDGSPESVWAVVSDLDTHPSWRPAVREFRHVSDGPLGVGARIREVLEWRGREIVIDDEVTAFDPPRRFGLHGSWKAAEFDLELRLEPVGEGTLVTMDWPLYPKSLVLKLAAPFMGGAMRKATREELELLKEHVERTSGAADAAPAP